MNNSNLQEKLQITVPAKDEAGEGWASADSARDSQSDVPSFLARTSASVDMNRFNKMPPGMEIDNQCSAEINNMPLIMSGQSDVSKDTNDASLKDGFKVRDMNGTDDQYTGEHVDLFYGDSGGFMERNNYLDRM